MQISARNQLKGTIMEIKEGSVNNEVIMDVGGGNTIVSTITKESVSTLGLKVGSEATAVIKATSVMLMA